jgi:hypothetical protein
MLSLRLTGSGLLPQRPFDKNPYAVDRDGIVDLQYYGKVKVAGLTLEEAARAIEKHLRVILLNPQVTVDWFVPEVRDWKKLWRKVREGEELVSDPEDSKVKWKR